MKKIPWSYRLYRWTWSGIDLLFPPVWGGCGKMGERGCKDGRSKVTVIRAPFCKKCGLPINGEDECEKCRENPPVYRVMRSWAFFDSPRQNALHTLKYRRTVGMGDSIAVQMAGFVRTLNWNVELLLPAPLGRKRLKERGYNQSGLVARPLAYELGLEYAPHGLRKSRETRSQVGLTISQRRENVRDAYQADIKVVNGISIILMDDVSTTLSTIRSCVEALLSRVRGMSMD